MNTPNNNVHPHQDVASTPHPGAVLVDPVCKMTVTAQSKYSFSHENQTYYFCSAGCKSKFAAQPSNYLAAAKTLATASAQAVGAIYTCPMHPEIRQDHPGNCPKCGMTLEPELPNLDAAESPELIDFRRRFWATLPLTVIVTGLASARLVCDAHAKLDRARLKLTDCAVGWLAIFFARLAIAAKSQP